MTDNVFSFAQDRATARAEVVNGWLTLGTLKIYTEPRPATPDTAITTQTELISLDLPDPAGVVENGVLTAGTIDPAMVAVSGAAAWARSFDSAGTVVADCDIGLPNSGAMVEISAINLVEGAYVSVLSFVLTEG